MSDLTRTQFLATWDRLHDALQAVGGAVGNDEQRAALQDVVSLCDSLKAAAVGHAASIGYAKRFAGKGADR